MGLSGVGAALRAASNRPQIDNEWEAAVRELGNYPADLVGGHLLRLLGSSVVGSAARETLLKLGDQRLADAAIRILNCWDVPGLREQLEDQPQGFLEYSSLKFEGYSSWRGSWEARNSLEKAIENNGRDVRRGLLALLAQDQTWRLWRAIAGGPVKLLAQLLYPHLHAPLLSELRSFADIELVGSVPAILYRATTAGDEVEFHRALLRAVHGLLEYPSAAAIAAAMRTEWEIRSKDLKPQLADRLLELAAEYDVTVVRPLALKRARTADAAVALRYFKQTGDQPLLDAASALRDGLPGARELVRAKGVWSDDVVSILIGFLVDEADPDRVVHLFGALSELSPQQYIPTLIEDVTTSSKHAHEAGKVLASLGTPAVDAMVRRATEQAADSPLIEVLAQFAGARSTMLDILRTPLPRMPDTGWHRTKRSIRDVAESVVRLWGEPWEDAIELGKALADADSGVRISLIERMDALAEDTRQVTVPYLIPLLRDPDAEVRHLALDRLARAGATEALPFALAVLGRGSSPPNDADFLVGAINKLITEQPDAVHALLRDGTAEQRRGALRWCASSAPKVAAVTIRSALLDDNQQIQVEAMAMVRDAGDVSSCIALLPLAFEAADPEVSQAAVTTMISLLAGKRLGRRRKLLDTLRADNYRAVLRRVVQRAREWVVQTPDPDHWGPAGDPASAFLLSLAKVLGDTNDVRPLLTLGESWLTGANASSDRACLVLVLLLDGARTQAARPDFRAAIALQTQAAKFAHAFSFPGVEWRSWSAIGRYLQRVGDVRAALSAFQKAGDIIDEMWFAILDVHDGRAFYKDKALFYDSYVHCCLQLRHHAMAFEIAEKAKTRYLGDLIARRHFEPREELAPVTHQFWVAVADKRRALAHPADKDATAALGPFIGKVRWVEGQRVGASTWQPLERSRLREQAAGIDTPAETIVDLTWELVARVPGDADMDQALAQVYESLQALRTHEEHEPSTFDHDAWFRNFTAAAEHLHRTGYELTYVFSEFRGSFAKLAAAGPDPGASWQGTFLNAVMEPLELRLKRNAVRATRVNVGEGHPNVVFETAAVVRGTDAPTDVLGTTFSETTDWDYIARLARGTTETYASVATAIAAWPATALLQFHVTESGALAFLVTEKNSTLGGGTGPEIFTLPKLTIDTLRAALLGPDGWLPRLRAWREDRLTPDAWDELALPYLESLWWDLFEPVDARLRKLQIERLMVVPHRGLQVLPLHSALRPGWGQRRHYLADDYEIIYAPSSTLAMISRERSTHTTSSRAFLGVAGDRRDLRMISFELDTLANAFPGPAITIPGAEALQYPARHLHSHLHFAGHAAYDFRDPLASCLLLSSDKTLSLADLFDGRFNAMGSNVCCLSACETAMSDPEDVADEYIGLTGGFLFAGTSTVVSTLWPVDDTVTALLMLRFYNELWAREERVSPGYALRRAQAWLRALTAHQLHDLLEQHADQLPEDVITRTQNLYPRKLWHRTRPFASPLYWAAFIVSAGPPRRTAHLESQSRPDQNAPG